MKAMLTENTFCTSVVCVTGLDDWCRLHQVGGRKLVGTPLSITCAHRVKNNYPMLMTVPYPIRCRLATGPHRPARLCCQLFMVTFSLLFWRTFLGLVLKVLSLRYDFWACKHHHQWNKSQQPMRFIWHDANYTFLASLISPAITYSRTATACWPSHSCVLVCRF